MTVDGSAPIAPEPFSPPLLRLAAAAVAWPLSGSISDVSRKDKPAAEGRPLKGLESAVEAPDSPLAPFDPRAKVSAALLTILTVSSFPAEPTPRFFAAGVYVLLLALVAAVGLRYLLKRCLAATPFIAMAALLPVLSGAAQWRRAGVCGRGSKPMPPSCCFSALAATTPVDHTLRAVGALGAPRVSRADNHPDVPLSVRPARRMAADFPSPRMPHGRQPRQMALSPVGEPACDGLRPRLERAERVTAAMILRGFNGSFPTLRRRRFSLSDWALGRWRSARRSHSKGKLDSAAAPRYSDSERGCRAPAAAAATAHRADRISDRLLVPHRPHHFLTVVQ